MRSEKLKFIASAVIILGVLAWLGVSGVQESKTYYATIPELHAKGDSAYDLRLRIAGDVTPGSIRREQGKVFFQLHQAEQTLQVVYVGREPLPDTFVDNAQAIVTGRYTPEKQFVAQQVQAKCASKYEALPPGAKPEQKSSSSY